ncbi:hypothetical protein HK104_000406, partial [Borealophlyctis nickersoniae]
MPAHTTHTPPTPKHLFPTTAAAGPAGARGYPRDTDTAVAAETPTTTSGGGKVGVGRVIVIGTYLHPSSPVNDPRGLTGLFYAAISPTDTHTRHVTYTLTHIIRPGDTVVLVSVGVCESACDGVDSGCVVSDTPDPQSLPHALHTATSALESSLSTIEEFYSSSSLP